VWTSADFELAWPKDLFVHELEALATDTYRGVQWDQFDWLLAEAFVSEQPSQAYVAAWRTGGEGPRKFVAELLAHRHELPAPVSTWPYWPRRHAPSGHPMFDKAALYHRFSDLIDELRTDGYLAKELSEPCPDMDAVGVDCAAVLAERLGQDKLWPLAPETWDDDTFYGLVEVFHDLVARPRFVEDCDTCIGHFSDFSTETGRALYRWKVNQLLEASGDPLRLADSGEDVGRMAACRTSRPPTRRRASSRVRPGLR
jgi:hypothetical protein